MFKLILPVGQVPLGGIVTKPTGTYQFRVIEEVRISGLDSLKAQPGTRILWEIARDRGECVPSDREVCWHVKAQTLREFLDEQDDSDK